MDIYALCTAYVNSRPGFDSRNYDSAATYRADQRHAAKDKETALALLGSWYFRAYVKPERLEKYLAESTGRLVLKNGALDYCTGQYYPTEYRGAMVRALSGCLWAAIRDDYAGRNGGRCDGAADYIEKSMRTSLPPRLYRRIKR